MSITTLKQLYAQSRGTDDFEVHSDLVSALLASNAPDVLEFHYECLRDRSNRDLYLRLRAAFSKRGDAGSALLLDASTTETDPAMRADLLHLLGNIGHPSAPPLARQALSDADADVRRCASYVLGWVGHVADVALLASTLRTDPDPRVRLTAATAHDQLYLRRKRAKPTLLASLHQALTGEVDVEVQGWIVWAAQQITGKRFGVRWDREKDDLLGDISEARAKCLRALAKLTAGDGGGAPRRTARTRGSTRR